MRIINQTKNELLADQTLLANTFLARLKGLLGRRELSRGEALALYPCSSVHTCFMKFAIDVIFLDPAGRVIYLQENLIPWRCSPFVKGAVTVVELPAGSIRDSRTMVGDLLVFDDDRYGGAELV
ncbi:DUF192 domain-containing protein [Desulfotomaculum nigrificans]|uniref:DUF192 domain-containing protein n=1 Tax=Desulfotomaculum nigrificans TaxID=1565 RepID=UPI0001FAE058|nr:DUF192 domain-containing protein [Desulfotomaculum nigrificans]